ncbi:MAG: bifunctional demethylmenaquinone methyltransferase/2-methoxy-6-polyprenyl-1,4-benzoquinol methylase UbiE [Lentisphaeria bacterium]|jgi:demethylmenaquinone methyltransferase/2-methoxy-6-polyprenyl-1,4-benzoquinol methylase|nr:bifunctional demethylmenaquinone methyltransferase/2-methoxy-6-polyprenyl-1,4-benzoquinol methylase UbiE [Lentisphaeria bacterium]MDP7742803.1 bifunctional demethylmenaquinone methyltransferase/2-methoxy-6-polyprenyl-1,4-benzoquinol methylase UbiE [Lentisphaeria bacterium]
MNAPKTKPETPSRNDAWRMFDRIAHRYDLLNHLLSLGQDILWRRTVARRLARAGGRHVLDIATGTGDQLFAMCNRIPGIETAVGIDRSPQMLAHGARKIDRHPDADKMALVLGDALKLPVRSQSICLATVTFGIRNVTETSRGLSEIARVLRPGGQVVILEFSLPANQLLRRLYLFYFRHILPKIGGLISGDSYAYQYLNETVETFPYGAAFGKLMTENGFSSVTATPLTFGVATVYQGVK